MRRRENSASTTPSRASTHLEDSYTPFPDVSSTSQTSKKKMGSKSKEMIGPEKHVAKVSRISSLMQQDSVYPKPPTPFPDQEKAERESRRRRSKSRIGDTKSLASVKEDEMEPKPPATPHPPDIHHKINRPKCDMPKIDITFTTIDPLVDGNHVGVSEAHGQYGHADRSRKFGMTYLEKTYGKPSFHLPDIKEGNGIVGRTHVFNKSKPSAKPSIINLDMPDDFGVSSKSEITLPDVNRKALANPDSKNLPPKPPRKSAVRRVQDDNLEHDKKMSPKPPKTAASRTSLNNNLTQLRQSPRETIDIAFEKLPATNQQKAMKTNLIVSDEELAAALGWSPNPTPAVEYMPNIATRSPLHFPPLAFENQNNFPYEEDPADAIVCYGSPPPRIKKGHQSEYVPHANRVMYHEEQLNDVEVHRDGTMVIGLDDMHFSPSPTGMAGNDREKMPLVLPTPKKLSITEQISNFKENQTTVARDARARGVQAEVAWRCERRLGDLKEEEERKFREQQYIQETISKPKPPYRLESRYVVAPPKTDAAPGQAGQQQVPASLRKRRQPRAKKDW